MSVFRVSVCGLILLLTLDSCKKTSSPTYQSAEDSAQIENEFAQISETVSDYVANDARTGKTDDFLLPNGAVVSFQDSIFSDGDGLAFTIDYGPLGNATLKGRQCKDGRYRAGKIHVGLENRWSQIPCSVTVAITSSDEYYAGNGLSMYRITGDKTLVRTSDSTYSVEVSNATMQRANGTVTWNAQRIVTITFDAGPGWLNDEFTISGSSYGTNANGEQFSAQILSPLVKKLSVGCMSTFVAGRIFLTNADGKELEVDYDSFGNAACDKIVTVSANGKSRNITLW